MVTAGEMGSARAFDVHGNERRMRGLSRKSRGGLLGLLAAVAFVAVPAATANAELRTGSASTLFLDRDGTPADPEMTRATVAYDTATGTIAYTVHLSHPLADWNTTSALRGHRVILGLGDTFYHKNFCSVTDQISGALVPNGAAPLRYGDDFGDRKGTASPVRVVSADRQSVSFFLTDDALINRNLICMDAGLLGPGENGRSSFTFGRLLDGFSAFDGELAEDARLSARYMVHLAETAQRRKEAQGFSATPTCRRLNRAEVLCTEKVRLRITGRPTLSLRITGEYRPDAEAIGGQWRWRGRWQLRYSQCPKKIRVARRSTRRACVVRVTKWSGSRDQALAESMSSALRRARTRR